MADIPRTAQATATNRARGDQTAAARLTKNGWLLLNPTQTATLPTDLRAAIDAHLRSAR